MIKNILVIPDTQEWRVIPEYPGYEVTKTGQVRSWLRPGPNPELADEPQLKSARPDKDGYLRVSIKVAEGKYRRIGVHRLVALAWHPETHFEGAWALHNDGDKLNNHADNIRWGTPAENSSDRGIHGTFTNPSSPERIKEIRRLYSMGFKQSEIARVFKTSQAYVCDVVNYVRRKDVV